MMNPVCQLQNIPLDGSNAFVCAPLTFFSYLHQLKIETALYVLGDIKNKKLFEAVSSSLIK